jgi:hypothetical protein
VATLQSYLTATQRLLHDANAKYWTIPTLIDAINGACKRVVGDSACNRSLQTAYLSGGLELYGYGMVSGATVTLGGSGYVTAPAVTFSAPPAGGTTATGTCTLLSGAVSQIQVTSGGSGYTSAPTCTIAPPPAGVTATATATILNQNTLDTLNITVQWGDERYILSRVPFTQFQAGVRSWAANNQRPAICASYGQNQWYIGPIPDQTYTTEWDTLLIPAELVNLTDTSVIQYPYSECVAFYAAHTAKYQEQSYAEADQFLKIYTQKMMYSRRSVMMRQLPSAYAG